MAKGFIFTPANPAEVRNAFNKRLLAAREQIHTDCDYYIRVDTGTMRDTAQMAFNPADMELDIEWVTPYAEKAYRSGKPSRDQNPNASLKWAEKAGRRYGEDWGRIIAKGMGGEYRGRTE